jgi:hypothetical protein
MEKKALKKLTLSKETLRSLDDAALGRIVAGVLNCPTLDCTKPEYNCTVTCDGA